MTELTELYANENSIELIEEFKHLEKCTKLNSINLSNNPVTQVPDYRFNILKACPSVKIIDNKGVTIRER